MSDQISRKIPMILSPVGSILNSIILLALSTNLSAPIPWILLGTFLNALSGGMITMITCTLSYLSAVTTEKTRTWRISIAEAMMLIAGATAQFVSGDLLKATGFIFIFAFIIFLNILVIVYVITWLKDAGVGIESNKPRGSPKPDPQPMNTIHSNSADLRERSSQSNSHGPEVIVQPQPPSTQPSWFRIFCNISYFTDSVLVVFRKREQNRKSHVIVQIIIIALFMLAVSPCKYESYKQI